MPRILELAEQAGFYIPQPPFIAGEQEQLDRINEFAQLIIEECMLAIAQEASISGIQLVQNSEMFAMGLIAANGVIKRRFGME